MHGIRVAETCQLRDFCADVNFSSDNIGVKCVVKWFNILLEVTW